MPNKSKAMWGKMFALEAKGEVPKGTAREFAESTKTPFSKLPTYSHSAAARRRRRQRRHS